jgi:hypothetical protein
MEMQVRSKVLGFAATLVAAGSMMAGAFVIQIGRPSANPEAQAENAVLVVRGIACVEQNKTTLTGSAEGIVNGKRESLALRLTPISGQTTYAVTRQWPSEGKWVLAFVMTNPHFGGQQSAIIKVEGDSVDWGDIVRLNRGATKEDVDAALNTMAVAAR